MAHFEECKNGDDCRNIPYILELKEELSRLKKISKQTVSFDLDLLLDDLEEVKDDQSMYSVRVDFLKEVCNELLSTRNMLMNGSGKNG